MAFKKGNQIGKETRFKPGQSGNPEGRIKGLETSRTRLLRFLELEVDMPNPVTGKKERATVLEMLDAVQIKNALNGDLRAYQEILDRFEGKVIQKSEVEHSGETSQYIFAGNDPRRDNNTD